MDVGGGAGWFTEAFRAHGARCFLVEPDRGELCSRETVPDGAVLGDGLRLPVRDGAADIAFSSNVLEHVPDPMRLIGEMIRVTRPGGLIYLAFTNWYSPWGGHEMSPWHYLGPGFAERRYVRRYQREPKHRIGATLFPVHVGHMLSALRRRGRHRDRRRPPAVLPAVVPLAGGRPRPARSRHLEPPADHEAHPVTSRVAVRPVAGRAAAGRGWRPFSIVDELNCYLDSAAEPNNVHLEVWLPGQLSPDGLRAAVTAALAGSPQARARRAAGAWWRSRYAWECPPEADVDPVSVVGWQDQAELDAARAQLPRGHPAAGPLAAVPPAAGPGTGVGQPDPECPSRRVRRALVPALLSLIAEHYGRPAAAAARRGSRQRRPPAALRRAGRDPAGRGRCRDRRACPRPRLPRAGPARRAAIARRLPLQRTARIAPRMPWPAAPPPARSWRQPAPVAGRAGRATEPGVTVNDLLIAALIQAVAGWNTARRRWSGRVRITMPVDTRPSGQGDELGNLARLCTVTVDPHRRGDLTAAVAEQTRLAKYQHGPAVGPVPAAVARARLPAPVKRWLLRLVTRSLGRVGCDTSLLSNLGNVADPPRFGPLSPTRLWFSTSAHMPRGLVARRGHRGRAAAAVPPVPERAARRGGRA